MNGKLLAACAAPVFIAATAQAATLAPDLAGLSFLLGQWSAGVGRVADTGGTSQGSSLITAEAGGGVLLRRDHTSLFNKAGQQTGGFDQIMMIYPEASQIHAEYADGTHIIHYRSASITPGHAVTFTSAAPPGAPVFKLTYTLQDAHTLGVSFAMVPPGATTPQPIATGTLKKQP